MTFKINIMYILPLIGIIILFSCQPKNNNDWKSGAFNLESTGEILSVYIDDSTPNVSMGLQYSNGYLFNVNWVKNEIQMYDTETGSLLKGLEFEIEGDQGVGQLFGFHVHNLDSIFLFPQFDPVIVLTDTSGLVKNRIRYNQPDMYSPAFCIILIFFLPLYLKVMKFL